MHWIDCEMKTQNWSKSSLVTITKISTLKIYDDFSSLALKGVKLYPFPNDQHLPSRFFYECHSPQLAKWQEDAPMTIEDTENGISSSQGTLKTAVIKPDLMACTLCQLCNDSISMTDSVKIFN